MLKGETKTGFKYQIEEQVTDDYELVELIVEAEENPLVFPKLINHVLGPSQLRALKEHVRDKEGRVSAQKMVAEITDIFQSQDKVKK